MHTISPVDDAFLVEDHYIPKQATATRKAPKIRPEPTHLSDMFP